MSELIYWAIPFFILTMVGEALWTRRQAALRGYVAQDSATSICMGLGHLGVAALMRTAVLFVFTWAYSHRLFDLPTDAVWSWALLLVLEDLTYYVWHRASHEVRFLWTSHVNHHSSTTYNLSTALRQSWTDPITGPVFWLPLVLLGFHPLMVLTQQGVSLLYQYWLHTETIHRLPFGLEAVLNTPSHHRVHHGTNPQYLDRNHAGIFIIWDRLFGTYEPEVERPTYGLTKNLSTYNPVRVAFHEWVAMGRDLLSARGLREALGSVLGPPGWRPNGAGETSAQLRARAQQGSQA